MGTGYYYPVYAIDIAYRVVKSGWNGTTCSTLMTSTLVNILRIFIYEYTVYYVVVAMNFACRKHDRYKLVTSRNRLADRSDEVQHGTYPFRCDICSRSRGVFVPRLAWKKPVISQMSVQHLTDMCLTDLLVPAARRCVIYCYSPKAKL